jgi:hypothetical protein
MLTGIHMRVQTKKPILFTSDAPETETKVSDDDRARWILTLSPLLLNILNHQRIISVDESCWCVHPDGLQTWAPTKSQNIQAFCHGDEKDSFTIVATITAARTELPLTLIATRKTHIVEENHFGDINYHRTDHSESGWTTTDTFQRCLPRLPSVHDDGDPFWLVLDCYFIHRQTAMKKYAEELGFHLLFLPPGLTDEMQPLDWFVFGGLKTHGRRMYRNHVSSLEKLNK